VGAILDHVGESFVAEDIQRWVGRPHPIHAPKIAALLGVSQLRCAPEAPEAGYRQGASGVPFYRFPQWMFCPNQDCRRLRRWNLTKEGGLTPGRPPTCEHCDGNRQLVPMRFVMVCGDGHLDDVDWFRWGHSKPVNQKQRSCALRDKLTFNVASQSGGGLESLSIRCSACEAERPLKGLASPHAPKALGMRCRGRQPWLPAGQQVDCAEDPVIVQRGASNVHFPTVASLIDIPPESDYDHFTDEAVKIRQNSNFAPLEANPEHPLREGLIDTIAAEEKVGREMVEQVLATQLGADALSASRGAIDFSSEQVLRDEWGALTVERSRQPHPRDTFVVEHTDLSNRNRPAAVTPACGLLADDLRHLVKVPLLREVRVMRGFHRYTMKNMVPVDLDRSIDWLPALEVYGEGIFLALDEKSVRTWEERPDVSEWTLALENRRERSIFSEFLPRLTPRFVMVHTLAHLLIRQLIYESGYSSSSIRERLYVSESDSPLPMAGLMVYTGAGDAEGTLGGLVRSGDPDWFLPTMITALLGADWCSLDPVCRESASQGPDGLSLAACHACALVAETSCQYNNSGLDRNVILDPQIGYLRSVLAAAEKSRADAVI